MSEKPPAILNAGGGRRLERSCRSGRGPDWVRSFASSHGIDRFEAWFGGHAYDRHRHETYAIGLTHEGVQSFHYRGGLHRSLPGHVLVLHPDEVHDGHAGTELGFGYRMLYVDPRLIAQALDGVVGTGAALPFVRETVALDGFLASTIVDAFCAGPDRLDELALDDIALRLAEGLLRRAGSVRRPLAPVAAEAVQRVRDFLDEEHCRAVSSSELQRLSGLDRFALARQFRARFGTSPYRYLTGCRLRQARANIQTGAPLAAVALDCGFADQSQMTRQFKDRYGLTPGQYASLSGVRRRAPTS